MADRQAVSAVVFDIGNVLVAWEPAHLYRKLIPDDAERAWFLDNVVTLEWHSRHDAGLPLDEGVRDLSARYPHYSELIAAFRDRWEETIIGPIPAMVAILEHLAAQGVPLFAITNYSAETFPAFRRRFALARHFRDVVVSGEEKIIKPDPRIFQIAIERFGFAADDMLFVDDRQDNIDAAAMLGFQTIRFTGPTKGPAAFADRLEAAGLLTAAERRTLTSLS